MKIAVLCGGRSYERQVSLRSGERVEGALHALGHESVRIDVGTQTARMLESMHVDCAFVALHGRGGEDGSVQELLELLDIPYTGPRPDAARISNDKALTKRIWQRAGLTTPPFVSLTADALQEFGASDVLHAIESHIDFPLVVKPASGGSALGVRCVSTADELPKALVAALAYDRHIVVEKFIAGQEVSVSLVGSSQVSALPIVHVSPRNADYFDFESRYTHGEAEFECPPESWDTDTLAGFTHTAESAYEAISMSGFGRVDAIIDANGQMWLLEINGVPGMTQTSLLPLACEAAGIAFHKFVQNQIDDALAQHATTMLRVEE